MLNNISIMGRLVKDPELRKTTTGKSVCSFTIANDRPYGGADNKETDFIDVVAWNSTAEFVEKNFHKGKTIIITGRLQSRTYKDREGRNVKTWDIVASTADFVPVVRNVDIDVVPSDDEVPF